MGWCNGVKHHRNPRTAGRSCGKDCPQMMRSVSLEPPQFRLNSTRGGSDFVGNLSSQHDAGQDAGPWAFEHCASLQNAQAAAIFRSSSAVCRGLPGREAGDYRGANPSGQKAKTHIFFLSSWWHDFRREATLPLCCWPFAMPELWVLYLVLAGCLSCAHQGLANSARSSPPNSPASTFETGRGMFFFVVLTYLKTRFVSERIFGE